MEQTSRAFRFRLVASVSVLHPETPASDESGTTALHGKQQSVLSSADSRYQAKAALMDVGRENRAARGLALSSAVGEDRSVPNNSVRRYCDGALLESVQLLGGRYEGVAQ